MTGGAGFIGSNLVSALLERNQRVRIFDDFSTGRRENLFTIPSDVDVVEGDVRDAASVREALRDVDIVYHEAAIPSVARSVKDPRSSHMVNATGTLNIMIAARDEGVERVVCASSSSVYGNADQLPVAETAPTRPISPYGVSKLAGENYLTAFHASYGVKTIALRFFNVFGPRQDPTSEYAAVVPRFVVATLGRQPAHMYGDGEQARDFTFVGDVVAANLLAADAGEDAWGRAFNIACGGRHTVNELLETIQRVAGVEPVPPEHDPPRPSEIRASQADIAAAREVLGYEPQFSFEEGLRLTVEWYSEQRARTPGRA